MARPAAVAGALTATVIADPDCFPDLDVLTCAVRARLAAATGEAPPR